MTSETPTENLVRFFKVLADSNRLKIIGLLARERLSVEQLAEMLRLRPSTVSHHLSRLAQVGLVSARAESYYNIYQFEPKALEALALDLLKEDTLPSLAADLDVDAYDRKVLRTFVSQNGTIKQLPAQQKKFEAVLRYVVQAFEPGVSYTEKEVNAVLGKFHEDVASLRRGMIEYKLMERESGGGAYWRL